MSELEVARVVLMKREDVSELVVDNADDFLCGKILGINPDAVDGLIATGVLTTPDGVGVEGVSGTMLHFQWIDVVNTRSDVKMWRVKMRRELKMWKNERVRRQRRRRFDNIFVFEFVLAVTFVFAIMFVFAVVFVFMPLSWKSWWPWW
jgi:hypothetical protein